MEIKYQLDKYYLPKTIHIVPGPNEDKNELARMSSRLRVANPAVAFADAATNHEFDHLTDSEYDKLLAVASRLSLLFYDPKTGKSTQSLDLFSLTVRLLHEYMLNNHSEASHIL